MANEIDDSESTPERHAEAPLRRRIHQQLPEDRFSAQTPPVSATTTPTTFSRDDLNKLARIDGRRLAKAVKTTMVPAASA